MPSLYEVIAERVKNWRGGGYPCEQFPAIGEIMEYQTDPESGHLRYLRAPQLRALETYWYLRLVEDNPHVFALYRKLFPKPGELLAALSLDHPDITVLALNEGLDALWEKIKNDDDFVRCFKLDALRETLTLEYPSYILALAMGAGKTVLIGAIIATELAMALEYPDGNFVQNALVFAPGKTIIESLRELAEVPYARILPPRHYKHFAASLKLIFTRDGEKDIPVIRGSSFNVIVTNTEKIRIQKRPVRARNLSQLMLEKLEQQEEETANLRLQAIASLPHLAVFSDEAHHTYGQSLGTELKRVRQTVDYLHTESPNLICVVNTTGTPYFQRQPLRDVVIWYGLAEGIRDGILKEVSSNIRAYRFDDSTAEKCVGDILTDFFQDYGSVTLPNGAPAKIALYFPQTDDLEELRPAVEAALAKIGLSPAIVLRNTNQSPQAEVDAFNRLNDPAAPHRVILLVNKGTEGWNCPSLFACALMRRLKTSNNFVLQAASRCLRQIPGNRVKARICLSMENHKTLDNELQETYGLRIMELGWATAYNRQATIRLRKVNIPPLVIRQIVRTVVRKDTAQKPLSLVRPTAGPGAAIQKYTFTIAERSSTYRVLQQVGDSVEIKAESKTIDLYLAAIELAAAYRLNLWAVHGILKSLYADDGEVPADDLTDLARQIEEQTCHYEVREETVEKALALVKPEGFNKELAADGTETYTAEITYPIDKEKLLARLANSAWKDKGQTFGFHYDPYNFDSNPEMSFFEQLLDHLNLRPAQVEDIYFTGALTDPAKTEFYVEYKGEDGKVHRYTPDLIIRRKNGKCLIVEIKSAQFRAATEEDFARDARGEPVLTVEGRKAVALKKWHKLNPDRLRYQIIFAGESVAAADTQAARDFVEE